MSTEIQIAILGIIGTLMGTVLGWVLNGLSQRGKLAISVVTLDEAFQQPDHLGGYKKCGNIEEAEHYCCESTVEIYNRSRETRIMRGIRLVFMNNKKILFSVIPKDKNKRIESRQLSHYEDVTVENVSARNVISLTLLAGLNRTDGNWVHLVDSNRIMLEYNDEKNKTKHIVLKKEQKRAKTII